MSLAILTLVFCAVAAYLSVTVRMLSHLTRATSTQTWVSFLPQSIARCIYHRGGHICVRYGYVRFPGNVHIWLRVYSFSYQPSEYRWRGFRGRLDCSNPSGVYVRFDFGFRLDR